MSALSMDLRTTQNLPSDFSTRRGRLLPTIRLCCMRLASLPLRAWSWWTSSLQFNSLNVWKIVCRALMLWLTWLAFHGTVVRLFLLFCLSSITYLFFTFNNKNNHFFVLCIYCCDNCLDTEVRDLHPVQTEVSKIMKLSTRWGSIDFAAGSRNSERNLCLIL